MNGKELYACIINAFFNDLSPSELHALCPNYMLWEAIRKEKSRRIAKEDILEYLLLYDAFWVLPEPMCAIRDGFEPEFLRVESTDSLLNDPNAFETLVRREPTYIVSCDFKWMIVLTTENTECFAQLCVIVCAK